MYSLLLWGCGIFGDRDKYVLATSYKYLNYWKYGAFIGCIIYRNFKCICILIRIVDFHHYLHLRRYSSPHQNSNPLRTSCLYPYGCTYYSTFDNWEPTHHYHRNVLLWLVLQVINGIHRKKFPTSVTKQWYHILGCQNVYLILLSLPFEQNSSRDCISVAPLVL